MSRTRKKSKPFYNGKGGRKLESTPRKKSVSINLDQCEQIACVCGCKVFQKAVVSYRVSAILSPTGKAEVINQEIVVCILCNKPVIKSEAEREATDSEVPDVPGDGEADGESDPENDPLPDTESRKTIECPNCSRSLLIRLTTEGWHGECLCGKKYFQPVSDGN